jgi:DNA polymerase III epsilon subunit family exonuclease
VGRLGTGNLCGEIVVSLPREYVVFDTETTGMPPGARLVEIGAVKVRGHHIVDRFSRLIHPECPIPPVVIRIHGIDDQAVANAAKANEVVPEFLKWAGKAPLVGHNVQFDATMLACEAARYGLPLPDNPTYCTLLASRRLLKYKSHALQSLVAELGLPAAEHHRALADALHTWNLMQKLELLFGPQFHTASMGCGRELCSFAPEPIRLPEPREFLREAALAGEAITMTYRLAHGGVFQALVSPRFFYRSGAYLWMEALCHDRNFYKTYRIDRILAAQPGC